MRGYYLSLSIVILFTLILRWVYSVIPISSPLPQIDRLSAQFADSESQLALTGRIKFSIAQVGDLELISGVSDALAFRLIAKKGEILALAKTLPEKERYKALELVHGIGPMTAQKFGQFLELAEDALPDQKSYFKGSVGAPTELETLFK